MREELAFTILVDNVPHAPGLRAEHGLAMWIDLGHTRILFDAGASDALLANARILGIDLVRADHLVLSHGHYDHTGGLPFLEDVLPDKVPVHAHRDAVQERYSRHADGSVRAVGLPSGARVFLHRRQARVAWVTEPVEIMAGVWLTGPVARANEFEDTGGDFWLDPGCTRADDIADDLALAVVRDEGLWIFLGCAHAGVVNTVQAIQAITGCTRVHALVGGMHLRNASRERLQRTAAFLDALRPTVLLPCHCSGDAIHGMLTPAPSVGVKGMRS